MYNIKYSESILFLLQKQYESEFKIIEDMNQHPSGLNFEDWLYSNGLIDY